MNAPPCVGQRVVFRGDHGVIVGLVVPNMRQHVHRSECPTCTCTEPDMPDGMWIFQDDVTRDLYAVWPCSVELEAKP